MYSTIKANNKYAYHTLTNAELTAAFVRIVNIDFTYQCKYHLFIKYGDKVYMDVNGIGEVVISFTDLQQNKYWKYYYDLSLLLTNDKNMVIKDLVYSSDYNDYKIYDEARFWSINTASIENDIHNDTLMVISYDDNCYYKMNPYDLQNMEYSSPEYVNNFRAIYMSNFEGENMWDNYYRLAIEYQTHLIEKKFDEIL